MSPGIYVHASPGTGKSVFSSTMFHAQQSLNDVVVAYYSFSATDLRRTTSVSLLCSLIYQILSSDISKFPKIQAHYSSIQELSLWTPPALWALFISLLVSRGPTPLLCIINGVHTFDPSSEPFLRGFVNYLASNSLDLPIKFIFIGELRQDLRSLLRVFPLIQLDRQAFMGDFAQAWADSLITRLAEDRPFLLASDFKKELEKKMHSCMDLVRLSVTVELLEQGIRSGTMPTNAGMVDTEPKSQSNNLSAYMSASIIEGSTSHQHGGHLFTPESLRGELEFLPYDMPSVVAARFKWLPDWAMRALPWILHAQRPIRIGELALALRLVEHEAGIRLEEDVQFLDLSGDLKRAFGPLLEVHGYEVSLRHEQVKHSFHQIIQKDQNNLLDEQLKHSAKTGMQFLSHWSITRILLKYLVFDELQEGAKAALREDH